MEIDLSNPQQLEQLQRALSELGQANPMQGEILHARHNAPAVSGLYSHLQFPVYQHKAYPKVLYREVMTESGPQLQQGVVRSAEEHEQRSEWCESPAAAREQRLASEQAIALAAAESAWTDRNLSESARRERAAADEASDGHLVEVPEAPRRPGRPRKDAVPV